MLFNSVIFLFAFLPITYAVFWALPGARLRYIWLVITGYVFYGYWDPRFCLLMAFSTLVSYLAGLAILRAASRGERNRWHLVVPVTIDLVLLGIFKYAGFAARSVNDLLASAEVGARLPVLDVVLPLGISFYTFHTISYIVDAYKGLIRPTRNLFEFSAYVSLFSQLVAGPIVRFRQIEADLENLGTTSRTAWLGIGVSFFVFGLVEKVLVADSLAYFVDPVFAAPDQASTLAAWTGVLGYTFQLLFDFSGYSSMAVGLGYMFGLRIPQNFNSPYKALNPSDFWRRWHISLSTCLRDYVYIPLGGNRGGAQGTQWNLFLTMLIGGLWHGANWTFLVWGAYHGLLLIAYRLVKPTWDRMPVIAAQCLTFGLMMLGWIVFRAESMTDAITIGRTMFGLRSGPVDVVGYPVFITLILVAAVWAMWGPNVYDFHRRFEWRSWRVIPLAMAFSACLAIVVGNRNSPFLYFQF